MKLIAWVGERNDKAGAMFILIGLAIVAGSVLGGYIMSHGQLAILWQPAEYIIILGAGMGAFFGSQTKYSWGLIMRSLKKIFGDPGMSKEKYLDALALLYTIFMQINRDGPLSLEQDIEKPEGSALFRKYPSIAKSNHTINFIADTLRVYITTGDGNDVDDLMKLDMEITLEEELIPAHAISHMAESMPGMGIVAAVLGVVLTMSLITEPPEILGAHIAAALIGTFVGILFCYGVFGPMGDKVERCAHEEHFYYNAIKEAIAASLRGAPPLIAIEYGRRAIPHTFRPGFAEMETRVKKS